MKPEENKSLLETIGNYKKLPLLGPGEIKRLCAEIRSLIIDVTLKNGGHLGGSLGAVEICVALLRVFNPGRDKIIFDVGHQTYAYKILTDRLDRFPTLRRKGGIAGFPKRSESEYDFFDVGHSSTSISAALGFAKARDLCGLGHEVVAVIGDGALLNGLALEALNNITECGTKLTVILNDNRMSISPRVGGMAEHLAKLSISAPYRRLKQFVKDQCRAMRDGNRMESRLARWKTKLKSLLLPQNMFENIGISYWGPFDGHNVLELEEIFEMSKQYPKPLLIHVITTKGKGCAEAETSPARFHGVGAGTVIGETLPKPAAQNTQKDDWTAAAAEIISALASGDDRVVALTAAMEDGTRLSSFKKKFPKRYFDVGIAEGHMLTYAAGLAAGGMRPIICVYSTFLQRAMDQLIHDICMQKMPVMLAVDRAGLNGEDGETHQGLLDMAWGRSIPGLVLCAPRDKVDLEFLMSCWLKDDSPVIVRYPKGAATEALAREPGRTPAPWLSSEILRQGSNLCVMGIGATVAPVLEAAERCMTEGIASPTVVDLRFASPLDWETIDPLLSGHSHVAVAEDGYRAGGVGEAIATRAIEHDYSCTIRVIGVEAQYIPHASRDEQLDDFSLTASGIFSEIEDFYGVTATRAAG